MTDTDTDGHRPIASTCASIASRGKKTTAKLPKMYLVSKKLLSKYIVVNLPTQELPKNADAIVLIDQNLPII